jgi:DNA-binding MarR family transcriptional regulator
LSKNDIPPHRPASALLPGARTIPHTHRKVGHLSRRLAQVYLGLIEEVLRDYQLDPAFYSVLAELAESPGLDQKRLGDALGIDRTTIGEIVECLESDGLVERRVSPGDRRARELRLTEKGEALRSQIRPAMLAAQERLVSPLDPAERPIFVDMLYRVVSANLTHEVASGWRRRRRPRP